MTKDTIVITEQKRVELQASVDSEKTQQERNRLGQFGTPIDLARSIVRYALSLLPKRSRIRFLDPGFGTGSFYSALLSSVPPQRIGESLGFEIDPAYAAPAMKLWNDSPLTLTLGDFTAVSPPGDNRHKPNLIVCNPPYVRHHHLSADYKRRLQVVSQLHSGTHINGLSGLYCYFLLISHEWMAKNGIAAWLIPSEFMDVNYGRKLKEYMLSRVTLLRIHRFDPSDVQFADALVSSAVLFFANSAPPESHTVEFTYGGTLECPRETRQVDATTLKNEPKWTRFPTKKRRKNTRQQARIGDYFTIKRGLATGKNKFFILTPEQVKQHQLPDKFLHPILPSPRLLLTDEIDTDESGVPEIHTQLFLLDCDLPAHQVEMQHPSLWRYLQVGIEDGVHEGYLCRHREPWYVQEKRPPCPFLCTYMGRRAESRDTRPFRILLNHSQATATNVYLLLYPKAHVVDAIASNPELVRTIWAELNQICPESMIGEGRVYGGGLHKLEPKELANVPCDKIAGFLKRPRQMPLFAEY